MKISNLQPEYFRPTNRVAAIWASCVEQFLIHENPDLSIREIRKKTMMRGVYAQLKMLEEGITVPEPTANSTVIERAAYNSQLFFGIGGTIVRGNPSYKTSGMFDDLQNAFEGTVDCAEGGSYDLYVEYVVLTFIGNNRLYSTDDLAGFVLCTLVYLAILLSIELANPTDFVRNAITDFVIKYVFKYFKKIFNIDDGAVTTFQLICSKLSVFEFATSYYRPPSKNPKYNAVPWKMPNDAQIILLGDWGTGLPDAHDFLYELWKKAFLQAKTKQIVFIHLGDIYYCGLNVECERFFSDVFKNTGERLERELGAQGFKANAPIFTVPGNHEYYCMGRGYFKMIDKLNEQTQKKYFPNKDISQPFSFFCLRTENDKWQFLGMDTGQDDGDGLMSALQAALERLWKPMPMEPELNDGEVKWLKDRLNEFNKGKTILLSHHQLFSRQAKLNFKEPVFMNSSLNKIFKPFFRDKVAAWFWGHEHTFALYKDGIYGLNKGRLLGSSSYEASLEADSPYKNNYPMVPFAEAMNTDVKLGETVTNGKHFFNHAAAIMAINNEVINVEYLQFPTWGQNEARPANIALTTLCKEDIKSKDFKSYDPVWRGNKKIEAAAGSMQGVPVYELVHSDKGHSMVAIGSTIYLLYTDVKDGNKVKMITTDADRFKSEKENKLYWTDAKKMILEFGRSEVVSNVAPAIFVFDSMIYAAVVTSQEKLYMLRYVKETGTWHEEFSSPGIKQFTPVVCLHHDKLYIIFRELSTPDKELVFRVWEIGNPVAKQLSAPMPLVDENGKRIKMNAACAVASNSIYHKTDTDIPAELKNRQTFMQMVFRNPDGDGKKLYSSRFINNKWSAPKQMRMNNYDLVADLSPVLVHNNAEMHLVYATGSGRRLKICFLDCARNFMEYDKDSPWLGDIEIKVGGKAVVSKTAASLAFAAGGAFLIYVNDDSKNYIYWANF